MILLPLAFLFHWTARRIASTICLPGRMLLASVTSVEMKLTASFSLSRS
jgi:hypothetical protein